MENEFKPYRTAIDALEAYLDKLNEFTDPEIVIKALVDGGFSPLDKKLYWNLKDSIRYHTERSKRLIIRDGKLGKAGWASEIKNPSKSKLVH